ncbi:MAG: hypothetical protein VYA21_00710, partial [Verrucomicrobiota bacterium]|nr:hypothetical protein [Verrucomicrobiota bacterium]
MNPQYIGGKSVKLWTSNVRWVSCIVSLIGICLILSLLPTGELTKTAAPGQGHWTSMLPPLLAVIVAISFRSLVAALSTAFLSGSILYYGWNPLVFIPLS